MLEKYTANNNTDYSNRFSTAAGQQYSVDTNGIDVTWGTALNSSGGTLNKAGAGKLTLTAAATFAGGTTVTGGTLQLNNATAAGTGTIALGSNVLVTNFGATNINTITGSGTINILLNGETRLNGDLSGFTGTINIPTSAGGNPKSDIIPGSLAFNLPSTATVNIASGGTLFTQNATVNIAAHVFVGGAGNNENRGAIRIEQGATISGNVTLTDNNAGNGVSIGSSGNVGTFSGVIDDGGNGFGIRSAPTGTGTLKLAGANTYSGATNWSTANATLNLANSLALQNSTLSYTNGILVFDSSEVTHAFTFGGLSSSLNISLQDNNGSPNAVALTVGNNNSSTTYSGVLSGSGSLTKVGNGTLILSGNNTYAGNTVINAGTLQVGNGGTSGTLGGGSITTNGTLAFNRTDMVTVASAIDGTGGLTQGGSGSLVLINTNSYAGNTLINAGSLTLDHSGANLGALSSSSVSVNGGTTLNVRGDSSIGGTLTVAGGATAPTKGTVNLQDGLINALSVGGGLTVGGGAGGSVLSFDIGVASGINDMINVTGAVTKTGTTTINLNIGTIAPGTYTLINAAGGLTAGGAGFVIGTAPAGRVTYSLADSTSTAEILTIQASPTPPTAYWTGAASAAGSDPSNDWAFGTATTNWSANAAGTVDTNQVPGSITDVHFTASNAPAVATLSTRVDNPYTINSLTFDTSAAPTITSTVINTAGNLTITAGGLTVSGSTASNTTITGSGAVLIGADQIWANNSNSRTLTVSSPINGTAASGTQTLTLAGVGTGGVTLSGPISDGTGGGKLALAFGQSGLTILSGNNTFTGGITITGGTVQLGNPGALNAAGTNALAFGFLSTGTLQLNGNSVAVAGLSTDANPGSPVIENANAAAVTLTANLASNSNYAGVLRDGTGGGALTLTKGGAGALTLLGANTYTGGTNIQNGRMIVSGSGGSLPSNTALILGNGTDSGSLQLGDVAGPANVSLSNLSVSGSGTTNAIVGGNINNSTLTVNTAGTSTYGGFLGGAGTNNNKLALVKDGVGTLILTASPNTYSGGTTVSAGTLQLNANNAAGTGPIGLGGNTLALSFGGSRILNTISGTSGSIINVLFVAGAETQFGGDLSNFFGTINIPSSQGGNPKTDFRGTGANISSLATINIANGGTLFLAGEPGIPNTGATVAASIFLSGTGNNENLGALRVDETSTVSGSVTLQGATNIGTNNGNFGTISGIIGDGGNAYSMTKVGGGTLTLSAANTLSGDTTLNAGTLKLANTLALQNSTLNYSAGTLAFDVSVASHAFTLGGLAGSKDIPLTDTSANAVALSIGNNNANTTYTGVLSGSGSINKIGSGALTLSGSHSYTGNTDVSGGTLNISAVANGATTTVAPNAVLKTNRIVQSTLNIQGSVGNDSAKAQMNVSAGGAAGSNANTSHIGTLNLDNDFAGIPFPPSGIPYSGPFRTYYGTLDLANNDLVIDNGFMFNVTDMIRGGMVSTTSPTWLGKGIGSSYIPTAPAPYAGALGLGSMRNDADPTTFDAESPASAFSGVTGLVGNEVFIKTTYYGDFNLDGKVNALDFALLDAGYAGTVQYDLTPGWFFGDTNYDGQINSLDFSLVDAGYAAYHSSGSTQLPEPGTVVLAALGGVGLFLASRRRRGQHSK